MLGDFMLPYNKENVKKAKRLRKNATIWENKLWYEFLSKYPIRFQRQKPIGNYIADFYCAKAKLIIELDGSGHYYSLQSKKDLQRTLDLGSKKLRVIRFSNADINNAFYEVCTVIDNTVKTIMTECNK